MAVAETFLAEVEFASNDTRLAIVETCQCFHEDTVSLSEDFMSKLRRPNYVTPTRCAREKKDISFRARPKPRRQRSGWRVCCNKPLLNFHDFAVNLRQLVEALDACCATNWSCDYSVRPGTYR